MTDRYDKLNVFRKRADWMSKFTSIPPNAKVFIQAENCLIVCGDIGLNVDHLPEALADFKLQHTIECKHEYESRQCQIRSGDEAFTSILICKFCNKKLIK